MKITPANFGMLYIAIVFGAASYCGSWEWSRSDVDRDPDGQWHRIHQRTPIWRPPTIPQLRQQFPDLRWEEPMAVDALIIRHDWTQWLAAVLKAIFPGYVLLTWLAIRPFRRDRNLRFMVTAMSGMYAGMIVWFVVWMCTAWRPPPILPYIGIGLVAGVVVATACRHWKPIGEPVAPPNGGPATPSVISEVTEGPPSVN